MEGASMRYCHALGTRRCLSCHSRQELICVGMVLVAQHQAFVYFYCCARCMAFIILVSSTCIAPLCFWCGHPRALSQTSAYSEMTFELLFAYTKVHLHGQRLNHNYTVRANEMQFQFISITCFISNKYMFFHKKVSLHFDIFFSQLTLSISMQEKHKLEKLINSCLESF